MKFLHQIALGLLFQHGHVGPSLAPLLQSPAPADEPVDEAAPRRAPVGCCAAMPACCG